MEHLASTAGSLFDSSIDTAGMVESVCSQELANTGRSFPTEILSIQSTTQRIVWQKASQFFHIKAQTHTQNLFVAAAATAVGEVKQHTLSQRHTHTNLCHVTRTRCIHGNIDAHTEKLAKCPT